MRFVVFGIKHRIEVIAARKIALRRTRRQPLLCVVANRAGFLGQRRELLDVAFDASSVAGKFQPLLFVSFSSRHDAFRQIARIVTGIAFQFMRLKRAWHFDDTKMSLMREAFVIWRRSGRRRRRRSGRRFGLLPSCGKRIQQRHTNDQSAQHKRKF